ncbi:deoxynucleoside triphosphate triphosphohydrolase SAMHD1, partial [Pelobates cultripes]
MKMNSTNGTKRARHDSSPQRDDGYQTPEKRVRVWSPAAGADYREWSTEDVCLFLAGHGLGELQAAFR